MSPLEPGDHALFQKEDAAAPVTDAPCLYPTVPVTPVTTLDMLAADLQFVSAAKQLPPDWLSADWEFTRDGIPWDGLTLREVYAPADGSEGWAVVYLPSDADGNMSGETQLLRGIWTIKRKGHNFERNRKPKLDKAQEYVDRADQLSEVPCG